LLWKFRRTLAASHARTHLTVIVSYRPPRG
jgi:hypothetical protein